MQQLCDFSLHHYNPITVYFEGPKWGTVSQSYVQIHAILYFLPHCIVGALCVFTVGCNELIKCATAFHWLHYKSYPQASASHVAQRGSVACFYTASHVIHAQHFACTTKPRPAPSNRASYSGTYDLSVMWNYTANSSILQAENHKVEITQVYDMLQQKKKKKNL